MRLIIYQIKGINIIENYLQTIKELHRIVQLKKNIVELLSFFLSIDDDQYLSFLPVYFSYSYLHKAIFENTF